MHLTLKCSKTKPWKKMYDYLYLSSEMITEPSKTLTINQANVEKSVIVHRSMYTRYKLKRKLVMYKNVTLFF